MISVGIIANPASGKDIRRLVAHGSVFDNAEKVNIVRRVLLGLDAVGVERVWMMPDSYGIGLRALDWVRLRLEASLLEMDAFFDQEDSRRAAQLMAAKGAGCLVTLGGDGTNRVVAKGCGAVPLMPISTGTNNVFPVMIEGTIAGLAAGLTAAGNAGDALRRMPRIEVLLESGAAEVEDIALVDAVVYAEQFSGARAMWDELKIRDIVLARIEPGSIGMSAVGAHLVANHLPPDHGVYLKVAPGGKPVSAPIAPGLIRVVRVAEHRLLAPGAEAAIRCAEPCVLALDGERELSLRAGAHIYLRLSPEGPWVVDARRAIALAAQAGLFEG